MLERLMDRQFVELSSSRHTGEKVRHCQVVEYTRIDPDSGARAERFEWVRSLCPWDVRPKDLVWKPIVRAKMTDADLLAYADSYPRLL